MGAPVWYQGTANQSPLPISLPAANGKRKVICIGREKRTPNTLTEAYLNGVVGTQLGSTQVAGNTLTFAFQWDDSVASPNPGSLPIAGGSYDVTMNGIFTNGCKVLQVVVWDEADVGVPFFVNGATGFSSPIQYDFTGAQPGALCIVAGAESSSSSSNSPIGPSVSLVLNQLFTANSQNLFCTTAVSTTTATVGWTSDDTYEGVVAVGVNPAPGGPANFLGGVVARQRPVGRGPQMHRKMRAFRPTYGSQSQRSVVLQLFSAPGVPLANTVLSFWTAPDEASPAIDGQLTLQTDAAGFVTLQNLVIPAGTGQVRCAVPGDPHRSRNFTVVFS